VGRRQRSAGHASQHLLHGELLAQLLCEEFRAQPLHRQQFAVHGAVGVADAGVLLVGLKQPLQAGVAGREVHVARRRHEHTFAQQAIQRLAPRLGRVQRLHVECGRLAPHAFNVALVHLIPLGAGDGDAIDLGHHCVVAACRAGVVLDAEEHEGRDDQQQQQAQGEL
jgi:hypothetical protein